MCSFVIAKRFFLWLQRIWRLSAPICDPSTAKKTLSSGSPVRSSGRPPHGRTYRGKPEGSTRSSSGPRPRKRCGRGRRAAFSRSTMGKRPHESIFFSPTDQCGPTHSRRDQEILGSTESAMLRRGPETCLSAHGKRLLSAVPAVRRLPEPQAEIQQLVVLLDSDKGKKSQDFVASFFL